MAKYFTADNVVYRATVVAWFLLGVVLGGLTMRVIDVKDYLDTTRDPQYMCHKGVAYQTMGDGEDMVFIKTNLQCLDN